MKKLFIQFYLLLFVCFLVMSLLVGLVYKFTAERAGKQSLDDLMKHHIANHQHSCTFKLWQRYFHYSLLRDANFARDNSTPGFLVKPSTTSASWR